MVTITFVCLILASSCRINEAAADSASLSNKSKEVFVSPTKVANASPTSEEKAVVSAEKKLQENFAEKIPKSGQTLEDFIPADASLVQKATGDLNSDRKADGAIIVLKKTSEVFELQGKITPANQYKQFLIITLQNDDGKFELQTYSSSALFPLASDNAENSTAEIKIKDGKIILNQIWSLNDKTSVYENSIVKTVDDWQVVAGRVRTEIPQEKIYKGGFRKTDVFETIQKKPVLLKDFDVEKFELKSDKKIRTY